MLYPIGSSATIIILQAISYKPTTKPANNDDEQKNDGIQNNGKQRPDKFHNKYQNTIAQPRTP